MMKRTVGKLSAVALLTASLALFAEAPAAQPAPKTQKSADELLVYSEDVVLLMARQLSKSGRD